MAIALLGRERVVRFPRIMWLDGLIGGLAVAAIGGTVILRSIEVGTGAGVATMAVNLSDLRAGIADNQLVVHHQLKIDRSFVMKLRDGAADAAIVESTIGLGTGSGCASSPRASSARTCSSC